MSSLQRKKQNKKTVQIFVTQHNVWGNLFFRRPSVFYIGRSFLWAPPVFHQGALCSGVSPQLMRSPMQQDVIAGSQCGRNSLPGTCMQRRLWRLRGESLTTAAVTDAAAQHCNWNCTTRISTQQRIPRLPTWWELIYTFKYIPVNVCISIPLQICIYVYVSSPCLLRETGFL